MAYCPANCEDITLTPNQPGNCDLKPRKRNMDRLGFYPCDTSLPSPLTCEALQTLVDDGVLVFSSPLANIEVQDPTFEELILADCLPADRIATSRIITFQDRIGINVPAGTSPVTPANPFFDYDFWADKKEKRARLRYLIAFCDGSVVIPKDENGNPMAANLDVFLAFERQGTGGSSYVLEIKKGQLDFKGDPLDLNNKPELTADEEVFDITACNFY